MINYLFKSDNKSDLQIINNRLEMLLAEQRHQRVDLGQILRFLKILTVDKDLQQQVDKYFDEDKEE